MKNVLWISLVIIAVLMHSCSNESKKSKTTAEKEVKNQTENARKYIVDNQTSVVRWKGKKPASYHNGIVSIKQGEIWLKDSAISKANVVIDMKSIENEDIDNPDMRQKFVNHLESDDFFHVEKYPETVFELTNIEKNNKSDNSHTVWGNLTIKGMTKNITFPVRITIVDEQMTVSSPVFTIDRTEWEIKYNSGKFFDNLKDRVILDNIEIEIDLTANLVQS